MLAREPSQGDIAGLIREAGKRVAATGLPVWQLGFYEMLIHPELPGRHDYGTVSSGAHQLNISPKEIATGDIWLGSPAEACMTSERLIINTLGETPLYDGRDGAEKDRAQGYRQFVHTRPTRLIRSTPTSPPMLRSAKAGSPKTRSGYCG